LRGNWWRHGTIFGAEIGYELGDLHVGKGVTEGRHFLAAVENLGSDFCGRPGFVRADIRERRSFFAANAVVAVAVGATFVAEEDSARRALKRKMAAMRAKK